MLDEGPSGFAGGMSAKNICRSPTRQKPPPRATSKIWRANECSHHPAAVERTLHDQPTAGSEYSEKYDAQSACYRCLPQSSESTERGLTSYSCQFFFSTANLSRLLSPA